MATTPTTTTGIRYRATVHDFQAHRPNTPSACLGLFSYDDDDTWHWNKLQLVWQLIENEGEDGATEDRMRDKLHRSAYSQVPSLRKRALANNLSQLAGTLQHAQHMHAEMHTGLGRLLRELVAKGLVHQCKD